MNNKCILINRDCTVDTIDIDKFNDKYTKIKNKGISEFVLIPISQHCEAYIAIPVETLPDNFKPLKIRYTLSIKVLRGISNVFDTLPNDRDVYRKEFNLNCKTLYELYVFAFSLNKLMAFNVLNNMSDVKLNEYNDYLLSSNRKPYIYYIDSIEIVKNDTIVKNDSIEGIEHVLEILSKVVGVKNIIVPNVFTFWIGKNHRCSYTPYTKSTNMIGSVNKVNEYCLLSQQCINYNAYSFINTFDESLLNYVGMGEMLLINYIIMGDEDDIPIDGPLNVADMLKNPQNVVVYRVEKYKLYTKSDYIEALTFAADMLQMMDSAKKMIGGDEAESESMIEINFETPDHPIPFSYTINKSTIDRGEINNVLDDFFKLFNKYIDNTIPF